MKLLYVEDNPADIKIFQSLISRINKDIILFNASSLTDADNLINTEKMDVIFLDCFLRDSFNIENTIKFIEKHKNTRIVLLTGLEDHGSVFKCINAGAIDFISKSKINKDHLERLIDYARLS